MDPVTLSILAGVAGTAASNLGTLMPSQLAQTNKKRLQELQRRESQGALGLTQKEEAAIKNEVFLEYCNSSGFAAALAQENALAECHRLVAVQRS